MDNVSTIVNQMKIKKRSDGRYEGRLTCNGTRKSFYGTTKTEVKNKAKAYCKKVENGYRDPEKITLNEYIEYWLVTYKLNKIELSSYNRLNSVYEHQIKNTIGQNMIGTLSTSMIQEIIDEYANPSSTEIRALALSGLKKIVQLLNPCLNMAVEEDIILYNPCAKVILPKENCITTPTKEQYSLTDTEIEQLKKACYKKYKSSGEYYSRDGFVLLLILSLGLRIGEMLALEWQDFDIANRIVHINKTIQSNVKQKGGGYRSTVKKSAKTRAGVRVIPLNDQIIEYITTLRDYDKRNGIHSPYVACTGVGTRNTARNLQRSLDRLVRNAEIEKHITLHILRHTFGSVLIRRGVGIEVVSKLMGHANITITYNKYIHVIQEEEAKAMNLTPI
ncbi:MAG: site-specific integrase [Clostridiales bacterium]|nr:site-specific integrase [Clostridiales bacterium]